MDSGDRPSTEDADDADATDEPEHDATDEPEHDATDEPGHDATDEPGHDATDEPEHDATEPSTQSAADPTNADADDEAAGKDGAGATDAAATDAAEDHGSAAGEPGESTAPEQAPGKSSAESTSETATADTPAASSSRHQSTTPGGDATEGLATESGREVAAATAAPDPEPGTDAAADTTGGPINRFLTAKRGPVMWIREMLSSAAVVLAIGLVLFAVSGVWPPMVAVESGSMEPNMVKGDLIFVTEPGRFAPEAATNGAGVVTYQQGADAGYNTFGNPGSVIVYRQPGRVGSPIIHRARFHVEAGENWYDRADKAHLRADNCEELTHCPAPHAGFITKGDANPQYDQANGIAPPVKTEWVTGVARVRIPYLGWVRLIATGQASPLGITPGTTLFAAGASAAAVGRRSRGAA